MTIEIIAEISGCHGGSLENAKKLIVEAHAAGATGVKFQCFQPERLAIKRGRHPRVGKIAETFAHAGLFELYRKTHTPREWFQDLIGFANEAGLTWHASVFDPDDVTFLETLDCPRYKISSFEANDEELAQAVIVTGKPTIVSINQNERPKAGSPRKNNWMTLHATDYGIPANQAGLRRSISLPLLNRTWGLSDHTIDHYAAEIATTLGASMIEWHLKLPCVHTPDDEFSWTWKEFEMKAKRVREIEEVLK